MSALLDFEGGGFDLSANARAPLARWAPELQARGRFTRLGRGPDAFDCMGLVEFVQTLIGRHVREYAYGAACFGDHAAADAAIRAESDAWMRAIGAPGDVLVCGTGRRAHHVAVLCGAGRALHAMERVGIAITAIEGRQRARRFAGLRIYGVVAPA